MVIIRLVPQHLPTVSETPITLDAAVLETVQPAVPESAFRSLLNAGGTSSVEEKELFLSGVGGVCFRDTAAV
jgi:hypothetical protein